MIFFFFQKNPQKQQQTQIKITQAKKLKKH